jgi:hypothetical protein
MSKSALRTLVKSDPTAQQDLNELVEARLARHRAEYRRDLERVRQEHDEEIARLQAEHADVVARLRLDVIRAEARSSGSLISRLFPRSAKPSSSHAKGDRHDTDTDG